MAAQIIALHGNPKAKARVVHAVVIEGHNPDEAAWKHIAEASERALATPGLTAATTSRLHRMVAACEIAAGSR